MQEADWAIHWVWVQGALSQKASKHAHEACLFSGVPATTLLSMPLLTQLAKAVFETLTANCFQSNALTR